MIVSDWAGYRRFRDAFASALDSRLYTIGWLDEQVLSGAVQVWIGRRAATITQLKSYPTGAWDIEGLIGAGDLDEIVEVLIPAAEAWGKEIGCAGGIVESRAGWARVLKRRGYRAHQVALRKDFRAAAERR